MGLEVLDLFELAKDSVQLRDVVDRIQQKQEMSDHLSSYQF